jgi:hypothetical protein
MSDDKATETQRGILPGALGSDEWLGALPEDALRRHAFQILSRLQSGIEDVVRLDVALAAVATERERVRRPVMAFAADLRACVPILAERGMTEAAAKFAKRAAELESLVGPNVGIEPPERSARMTG